MTFTPMYKRKTMTALLTLKEFGMPVEIANRIAMEARVAERVERDRRALIGELEGLFRFTKQLTDQLGLDNEDNLLIVSAIDWVCCEAEDTIDELEDEELVEEIRDMAGDMLSSVDNLEVENIPIFFRRFGDLLPADCSTLVRTIVHISDFVF